MSTTLKKTFKLSALSAAMLAAYGPALAQDASVTELTTPVSSVSVDIGSWSSDRPQQGIYDGMPDAGLYPNVDASILRRDNTNGTWLGLKARNLGLDTRELRLDWQQQGNMGAYLEFNQITRHNPYTYYTGLQGIGTTSQIVSGAGASALPFREVRLDTRRDQLTLGIFKYLMPGLDFRFNFRNEDKTGNRHYGFGSQPLFLAEPIDSTIRQMDATFNYSRDRLQVAAGWYGSWYDTSNKQIFGLVNGAAQPGSTGSPNPVPLSQPLDNGSNEFFVDAGYSFTPTTRGSFKVKYGRATQDEYLPSWALAAPNNRFLPMPSSIDGRIDTTLVEAGVTSRPIPKLSLLANLRYYNVDEKTPLLGVVGTNPAGPVTVHNTPQWIKTMSGKVEAAYRLPLDFTLIGGVDYKTQDRFVPAFQSEIYVPYRADMDETTLRLQVRRSLSETINGSLAYLHSKRDGSSYSLTEHFPSDLVNPIHIADRNRDKVRLMVDWTPMENFTIQGNIEEARDKYPFEAGRPYGLTEGKASLYSIDATYSVNEAWQVFAWYAYDRTKANQYAGRWDRITEIFEGNKDYRLQDTGNTFGFGTRGKINPRWGIGGDVLWARSVSKYDQTWLSAGPGVPLPGPYPTGAVTAVTPPNIENTLTRIGVYTDYAVIKNGTLRLDVIYEKWHTDDWSWQFADGSPFTYGTTTDGTYLLQAPTQRSWFTGIRYIYKFQ